jgi:hypothetical protein
MRECEKCKKEFEPVAILDTLWEYENIKGEIISKWTCFECESEINYKVNV